MTGDVRSTGHPPGASSPREGTPWLRTAPGAEHAATAARVSWVVVVMVLVTLFLVLGTGLGRGTALGAGDNGDGVRLYCGAGIVPDTPDGRSNWRGVVIDRFVTGHPPCPEPVPSSALLPLRVSVWLSGDTWDIRLLGLLYGAIVIVGVGLAATAAGWSRPRRALIVLPVALPLVLPLFSRFLLSTYSEPAGLVGAVVSLAGVTAAVAAPPQQRIRWLALVVALAGGIFAATAKPAYAVMLLPAVVACVTAAPLGRRRRGLALALVAVIATAVPVAGALAAQDRDYGAINTHNLLFTAVGPASSGDALDKVGLPRDTGRGLGQAYYPDGGASVPNWDRVIGDDWLRVRHETRWYVLTHPRAALRLLDGSLRATSDPRLAYLPSDLASTPGAVRTPIPDPPVGEQGADGPELERWLVGRPLALVPLLLLAAVAVVAAVAFARRDRSGRSGKATVALAVAAAASMVLSAAGAVAGDGFFEIAKHTWLAAYLGAVAATALLAAVGHLLLVPTNRVTEEVSTPRPAGRSGTAY